MAAKKTDPYSLRHQAQNSAGYADQAEFMAFKNGSTVIDAGVYDERVAGAMDDFESYDSTVGLPWHGDDLKYDTAVGRVHEEINRRIRIMGDNYPFNYETGTLTHNGRDPLLYEFFLSICNSPSLTSGCYVHLPRIFERISARIVAAYFGLHSHSIHTGAPRDPEVGCSFKNAMKYVELKTGEWTWGPDDGLPDEPVPGGDGGCDFVVWPDTLDGRQIGQLFVLGQCACGNNWNTKLGDLSLKKLEKWFNPLSRVAPVRTFTTPFHVTDALLKESSREAGLFFDRARLVLAGTHGTEDKLMEVFGADIRRLVELVAD